MKRLIVLTLVLIIFLITVNTLAVEIDEDNQYVIIQTEKYELYWNKAAQMGYMQAFVADSDSSLITPAGRAFYHSSNYAGGWKDWGALEDWEILEKGDGKAFIEFQSHDGGSKQYSCVATYWDSVEYIKHEVTVTNTTAGGVMSFESGHEPQFETNSAIDGMKNWNTPIPHAAYWINGNFAAIYGPDAQVTVEAWGGRNPGRMSLNYNNIGKNINKGESHTITYYVAFGKGEEDEATVLSDQVSKEPSSQAVYPNDKLSITWGNLKID